MFSISEETQNFKPIDLQSLEQKIGAIPNDMKNAIELYNKALDDAKGKNEDMAIIALKKAISIYPAFYEAMNLMGICYESLNDVENARRMFQKVIQMDDSSIRASEYLGRLEGKASNEESRYKAYKKNRNSIGSWINSGLTPERNSHYYLKYILGILIGVVLMGLIWLAVPANKPLLTVVKEISEKEQLQAVTEERDNFDKRLKEAMTGLEAANQTEKQLRDEMDQYKQWSATRKNLQALEDQGKYMDVVKEVETNLTNLAIPKDVMDEINLINGRCKPLAVKQFFDSAVAIYNSNAQQKSPGVYQQAASEFAFAIRIVEEHSLKPNFVTDLYYMAGKAVALSEYPTKEEANTEAKLYFTKVTELAPGRQIAKNAAARIGDIDQGRAIKH